MLFDLITPNLSPATPFSRCARVDTVINREKSKTSANRTSRTTPRDFSIFSLLKILMVCLPFALALG